MMLLLLLILAILAIDVAVDVAVAEGFRFSLYSSVFYTTVCPKTSRDEARNSSCSKRRSLEENL